MGSQPLTSVHYIALHNVQGKWGNTTVLHSGTHKISIWKLPVGPFLRFFFLISRFLIFASKSRLSDEEKKRKEKVVKCLGLWLDNSVKLVNTTEQMQRPQKSSSAAEKKALLRDTKCKSLWRDLIWNNSTELLKYTKMTYIFLCLLHYSLKLWIDCVGRGR